MHEAYYKKIDPPDAFMLKMDIEPTEQQPEESNTTSTPTPAPEKSDNQTTDKKGTTVKNVLRIFNKMRFLSVSSPEKVDDSPDSKNTKKPNKKKKKGKKK